MYILFIFALLIFYLNLSKSQCPISCNTAISLDCYITNASPDLEDNWIETCYDPSSLVQILNIFITDYQYSTFPINSQQNLTINSIIIHFYQTESLILTSSSYNSNISSLTLSGSNSFTSGLRDFLSHFPNLISLYIMNNTQLRDIADRSFVSLTGLQLLTVEGVGIERIGENLFVGLSGLIRLEWTDSNTSVLASSALYHLTSLQYLNLQNNRIASIPGSLFRRYLPNLQHISLASNQLRTVPYQSFEQTPLLSLLRLDYNPINCNCDLYWMYYVMSNYNLTITLSCAQNYSCNQTSLCYTIPTSFTTARNTSQISNNCNDEDTYDCLSPSQPCQHICTNSPTGFNCSCDEGYTSFCSDSPCCISSVYSCPINLTEVLQDDIIIQVPPLQLAGNRSIVLSSAEDQITLNLSISASSHVLVLSCQVDWQQCVDTAVSMTLSESFSLAFSLPSAYDSPLHYLLLRVEETESGSVHMYERLLAVIQSSDLPTLYTRSLVTSSVSSDVFVGVAVSSLEPSLCSEVCPILNVSLFSVGLVEVDISEWGGVSVQLVSCVSLPTQHWMSYSSYLFSIEWSSISSELNGRYELRVNGSGLVVGGAEFSIDYPVADNACEGRLEMGVYWNWTSNGTTSTVPCYELFGPQNNEVELYFSQVMERSCNSNLKWSGITTECSFYGNITKILSFSALIVPSPQLFTSLYFPTIDYAALCITYVRELLLGFLRVDLISSQQRDNLVIFWFNASNVTFDKISNFPSTELSVELSQCLTDYSLHFLSQSTACSCVSSPTEDTYRLQHTVLCDRPACDCSGSSCICKREFYGDGTNCSFDTDGDGLPDHPVTCGDSPCVDMCPYQSRCESTSTVSEKCESVCPIDTDTLFSIAWPCTAEGASREVSCPTGGGTASRYCGAGGSWTQPDTQSCVSAAYANLTQLDQLLGVLIPTPPVVYGDLLQVLSILGENSNNAGSSSIAEERAALDLVSQTISLLVSDTNIDLLIGLQRDRPVAELLLNYTEVFVRSLAMRDCTTLNIEHDRVNFRVVPVSQAVGGITLSAANINIGESSLSPSVEILLGDASCASVVFIENIAGLVTETSSSLQFGSEGLADTSFEQIIISSPVLSVDLYQNNQIVSEEGGDPLVRLNIPIDTSDIDLDKFRIEIAVGFLSSESGIPRWEGDGIDLVSSSVAYTVSAEATHLTSFTALIGVNTLSVTSSVIPVIAYVGCSIAILCLVLSLIMYVILGYRLLKKIYHFVHFNLALSLLLSYVVFMLGVELGYANFLQLIPCKIISGLLTYLILVSFLWMLVEMIVILIMAVWPYYNINKKYFILFFCICWLAPLLYTLITLPFFHSYLVSPPSNANNTTTDLSPVSGVCWIHADVSTSVAVLFLAIPAVVVTLAIITISITVGIYVLLRSVRIDEPELPKSAKASIQLFILFSIIFPFVIIGWLFGLLAISLRSNVLFWLFAISASAQGILFLLLVILIRNSIYLSILRLMARVCKCLHIKSLQRCLTQQPSREVSGYDEPFSDEPTATHISITHITPSESTTSTTRAPPETDQEMTVLNKPIQELQDLVAFLDKRAFDRPKSSWKENKDYFDNLTTRI